MPATPDSAARPAKARLPWKRRLLYSLVLLAALLALLELLAFAALRSLASGSVAVTRMQAEQAIDQTETVTRGQDINALVAIHPFLGYVYDPKKSTPRVAEYHRSGVSDYGFLDPQSPVHKRSQDKLIIGITGGSVAYWFSALGAEALAEVLSRSPRCAGKELVFVRLGLGAYKQPQQLMALTWLLSLGAEFDVLLNLDGFNEVTLSRFHNVKRGVNPFFPNAWDMIVGDVPDTQSRRLIGEVSLLKTLRTEWAQSCSASVFRHLQTGQLVWLAVDRAMEGAIARSTLKLEVHEPAGALSFAAAGPRARFASDRELVQELAAVWKRCSLQLHQVCRANGILYFHCLQPNQYVPGSKPMGAEERRIAYDPASPYATFVAEGYPLLSAAGQDLAGAGEPFTDLTRIFERVEEALYVDQACHINKQGNEMMAREIGRVIVEGLSAPR